MFAATIAGMAFSNASVALVHGMSRPIGVFFHVPHGLSNAMLLPAITAFSVDGGARSLRRLRPRDGRADGGRATTVPPSRSSSTGLYRRNRELQVPSPKSYGIPKERYFEAIPTMAAQALASGLAAEQPQGADAGRD